jgi:hypothetical protein
MRGAGCESGKTAVLDERGEEKEVERGGRRSDDTALSLPPHSALSELLLDEHSENERSLSCP